jgi:hypothetical protein
MHCSSNHQSGCRHQAAETDRTPCMMPSLDIKSPNPTVKEVSWDRALEPGSLLWRLKTRCLARHRAPEYMSHLGWHKVPLYAGKSLLLQFGMTYFSAFGEPSSSAQSQESMEGSRWHSGAISVDLHIDSTDDERSERKKTCAEPQSFHQENVLEGAFLHRLPSRISSLVGDRMNSA